MSSGAFGILVFMLGCLYVTSHGVPKRSESECKDTGDAEDCEWWQEQKYCTDETYKGAMLATCRKTCGCPEVESLVKRECENKGSAEDCEWWAEQGYCTEEKYSEAMMDECPCSCGSEKRQVDRPSNLEKRQFGRPGLKKRQFGRPLNLEKRQFGRPGLKKRQVDHRILEKRQFGRPGLKKRQFGRPGLTKRQFGRPGLEKRQFGRPGLTKRQFGRPELTKRQFGRPELEDAQLLMLNEKRDQMPKLGERDLGEVHLRPGKRQLGQQPMGEPADQD